MVTSFSAIDTACFELVVSYCWMRDCSDVAEATQLLLLLRAEVRVLH